MPALTKLRVTEERVAVIVGDTFQLKLLGIPSYTKATEKSCSEIIARLTMKLMTEWNCHDHVVNNNNNNNNTLTSKAP